MTYISNFYKSKLKKTEARLKFLNEQYNYYKKMLDKARSSDNELSRLWKKRNKDKIKEYQEQRYLDINKEIVRLWGINYRLNNEEKVKQYRRQYYLDNKEKLNKNRRLNYLKTKGI